MTDISVTKESGNANIVGINCYKSGRVINLFLTVMTTGSTVAGGNMLVGTLNKYHPIITAIGAGYVSASCEMVRLDSSGRITIRNLISDVPAGTGLSVYLCYIT